MANNRTYVGIQHRCSSCGTFYNCDDRFCELELKSACPRCSNICVPHSILNVANSVARFASTGADGSFERSGSKINYRSSYEYTTTW